MKNILVIPFYKNEHYIDNFVKYFSSYQSEYDLFEKICIFNDCPDSPGSIYLEEQCVLAKFEYIPNEINLGFLKTANRGFAIAKDFEANLVILNSDTLPHKNAFYELLKCFETDSMIGCVAPRSNNATICNLFSAPFYIESDADLKNIVEVFEASKEYVPQISYAPVTNGFCIAIRSNVIKSFPGYSEEFNPGYEEENDYCLRVASHGFRIAIANHGFIGHLEGRSFGLNQGRNELKDKNHYLLLKKYNYYNKLLEMHSREHSTRAYTKILSALKRGVDTVLVDASNLGSYFNGTNKLIVEFVRALAGLGYKVDILANEDAFHFHGINKIYGVNHLKEGANGNYLYGFYIGQPFNHGALTLIPLHSAYGVNIFFDSIAIDCPQIYIENPEIYGLWAMVESVYSHISFISEHSRKQFQLRFVANKNCYANLLPRVIEYHSTLELSPAPEKKYALVMGNKFTHKGLGIALLELPKIVGFKYLILCGEIETADRGDIVFLQSGGISKQKIDELYANCEFVIFPSFAEGFGFPLLEALSYRKKIYLRDIECYREIVSGLDSCLTKYIKFVDSFSEVAIESRDNNGASECASEEYIDYLNNIFEDIHKNQSKEFFNKVKNVIQILDLINMKEGIKVVVRRYSLYKYNELKKIRILNLPLRAVKKILKLFGFDRSYFYK